MRAARVCPVVFPPRSVNIRNQLASIQIKRAPQRRECFTYMALHDTGGCICSVTYQNRDAKAKTQEKLSRGGGSELGEAFRSLPLPYVAKRRKEGHTRARLYFSVQTSGPLRDGGGARADDRW